MVITWLIVAHSLLCEVNNIKYLNRYLYFVFLFLKRNKSNFNIITFIRFQNHSFRIDVYFLLILL